MSSPREIIARASYDSDLAVESKPPVSDESWNQKGLIHKIAGRKADFILAAVSANGCVVVPREPTPEMLDAGYAYAQLIECYRAMVRAVSSPSPVEPTTRES